MEISQLKDLNAVLPLWSIKCVRTYQTNGSSEHTDRSKRAQPDGVQAGVTSLNWRKSTFFLLLPLDLKCCQSSLNQLALLCPSPALIQRHGDGSQSDIYKDTQVFFCQSPFQSVSSESMLSAYPAFKCRTWNFPLLKFHQVPVGPFL